jgi:cobalt-zinc-cadmium efflux system outer membrane protein
MRRYWLWMGLVGVVLGCAPQRTQWLGAVVSSGIEDRSGYWVDTSIPPAETVIPAGVSLNDAVSDDEAVAIALWNNPGFREAITELGIAEADLIGAGLLSNPVLSILFPLGPKQLEFAVTFPLEALWLRHRRVDIAELEGQRVGERLVQHGLDLVRDVRVTYADLALVEERLRIATEAKRLAAGIAELAARRVEAGESSELETAAARLDARRAAAEAARLEHEAAIVRDRLRWLTGLDDFDGELTFVAPRTLPNLDHDVRELIRTAMAARPDLRASELAMEAACQRAGLEHWQILRLSGVLDANEEGEDGFEIGPGLEVELPIFNRNQDGVARARAEIERAVCRQHAVRSRIRREVREAHRRYVQAQELLDTTRNRVLPEVRRTMGRAEKAYAAGEASYLLVLETMRQRLDSETSEAEAIAALRRAQAELERSVGSRLNQYPKATDEADNDSKVEPAALDVPAPRPAGGMWVPVRRPISEVAAGADGAPSRRE